jgi:hypothetical protein
MLKLGWHIPRGSKLTISNCGPRIELNKSPSILINSMPLPQGPPGLNRIGPLYSAEDAANVDGFRMRAMTASAPSGSE